MVPADFALHISDELDIRGWSGLGDAWGIGVLEHSTYLRDADSFNFLKLSTVIGYEEYFVSKQCSRDTVEYTISIV